MSECRIPEILIVDKIRGAEIYKRWIQSYEIYENARELENKSEKSQVGIFLNTIGSDGVDIYNSFEDETIEVMIDEKKTKSSGKKNLEWIKEKFKAYFIPKRNLTYERYVFFKRDQFESENIECYYAELRKLAMTCEFKDLKDSLIKDRIIIGMIDNNLHQRFLQEVKGKEITAEEVVQATKIKETSNNQMQKINNKEYENIDYINKKINKYKNNETYNKPSQKFNKKKCGRCDRIHEPRSCKAFNTKCNICNKLGHWAKCCKSRSDNYNQRTYETNEICCSKIDENFIFLGEIKTNIEQNKWIKDLTVNCEQFEKVIKFKIDTGASVSVMPYNKLLPILKKTNIILRGPNNTEINAKGYLEALITYKGKTIKEDIFILEKQMTGLLSRKASIELDIVKLVDALDCQLDPKLFDGLGSINRKYKIEIKEGIKPYSINVPRPVPVHQQTEVQNELQKMIELGVIEEACGPTEWCSPMVIAKKGNGKIRICTDLTKLNAAVKREIHPMATVEGSLSKIKGNIFSKLDANSGFWQIPLEKKCWALTTFLTPWGRYYYKKLPFGLTSAPEIFCKEISKILKDCKGLIVHVDDVLVMGMDAYEHDRNLKTVLNKIVESGLTLNKNKCVFRKEEVDFLGFKITSKGIKAGQKVQGIIDIPTPTSVKSVRSFLGMINQFSRFNPNISEYSAPLRELLRKDCSWIWDTKQEESFRILKEELQNTKTLSYFDVNKKTILTTDASDHGIGAILTQEDENGNRKMIGAASRSLSDTEKRYATIEKEALGVVWALERFNYYIVGAPIYVETDHKPLITLLGSKEIEKVPIRIQRYRIRLMRYAVNMKYIPGKNNIIADTLSRYPSKDTGCDLLEIETEEMASSVFVPGESCKIQSIIKAQNNDPEITWLKKKIIEGWTKSDLKHNLGRKYYNSQQYLSTIQGCLTYQNRAIIPVSMRKEMLRNIHIGHLGITKCLERAKKSVFWFGISNDIDKEIRECINCNINARTQREPVKIVPVPSKAWETVGSDLFQFKQQKYIIVVDYYSRYIETMLLKDMRSITIISSLKSIFARHGIPENMISDNGTQYSSEEFKEFSKTYKFKHLTSSPKYPKGNGVAERAIQTLKQIMEKSEDPYLGLLSYRNTPLSFGRSPAELLMNRRLNTTLPDLLNQNMMLEKDHVEFKKKVMEKKLKEKQYSDNKLSKTKRRLALDEDVYIKDMDRMGTVIQFDDNNERTYTIKSNDNTIRRNRIDLVPVEKNTIVTRSGREVRPPQRLIEQ